MVRNQGRRRLDGILACSIDLSSIATRSYFRTWPLDWTDEQVVHRIYAIASPLPQLDCVFFLLTIRARNVFVNGLFNDPFQTLFSYLGVLFLLRKRQTIALTFFSLGASTKMSGLLWAPGVAAYLVAAAQSQRRKEDWLPSFLVETIKSSIPGLLVQVLVAIPFRSHLWHYFHRSFELDRTFTWFNVHTL